MLKVYSLMWSGHKILFSKQVQQSLFSENCDWRCQISHSRSYNPPGMNRVGATLLLFFAFQEIVLAKLFLVETADKKSDYG